MMPSRLYYPSKNTSKRIIREACFFSSSSSSKSKATQSACFLFKAIFDLNEINMEIFYIIHVFLEKYDNAGPTINFVAVKTQHFCVAF